MSLVVLCVGQEITALACSLSILLSDSGWGIVRVLLLWMMLLKRWPLAGAVIVWKYMGNPSHGLECESGASTSFSRSL